MGASKTLLFTERQNHLASIAKALSHPARIAILEVLIRRQSCVCGDIVDELPLAQATVSQHLKELKAVGLIKGEIEGKRVCYCIDLENWELIEQELSVFFGLKTNLRDCC